jgi:hypothetical protein
VLLQHSLEVLEYCNDMAKNALMIILSILRLLVSATQSRETITLPKFDGGERLALDNQFLLVVVTSLLKARTTSSGT